MIMPMNHRRGPSKPKPNDRRGVVLIAALVCLSIVLAMLGSMLLGALRRGRELHAERDRRQCELLLEAGVDRAVYRLAKEPSYRGETWTLRAPEITSHGSGLVRIKTSDDFSQSRRLEVVAEYPAGDEFSIRRSRSLTLPIQRRQAEE